MDNKKTDGAGGFFGGLGSILKSEIANRRTDTMTVVYDVIMLCLGFFFSRCHIAFGAYPLGVSLVAVLPRGVFSALIGAVIGSITLGKSGVIHAIIAIIVVFLRVIISGGEKRGSGALFSEPLVLRLCSGAIGAFVGAVYEILLKSLSLESVLYGIVGVLLTSAFTFALSGVFDGGISISDVIFGSKNIFLGKHDERRGFALIVFQASFLILIFLVSISLAQYEFIGISPAYIFATFITLFVARRFGAVRAMAVGFVSSLGISSTYSVAFALLGLGAGVGFSIGLSYGVIFGGLLLALWSAYSGGLVGFLSTFPEFASGAVLSLPVIRKLRCEAAERDVRDSRKIAEDMVATTALTYKKQSGEGIAELEGALYSLGASIKSFMSFDAIRKEDCLNACTECLRSFCQRCPELEDCLKESPAPCAENLDLIAERLYRREGRKEGDFSAIPSYCKCQEQLYAALTETVARERSERLPRLLAGEEYELISRLLSEARLAGEREQLLDSALSEKLAPVFAAAGLGDGVIKAFGERRRRFIGAGEDKDGRLITSPEIKKGIENTAGVRLGGFEYCRNGDVAMVECRCVPIYSIEFATAGEPSRCESVSGDSMDVFETSDGHFYSLICDGTGRGEGAAHTSAFSVEVMRRLLPTSCKKETALKILNLLLRSGGGERSGTVDLFDMDLLSGEATFYKCGAAASYIKREKSIFRVRSESAPIGIMKDVDTEKIRVEAKAGDYVVMLSDGVSDEPEDAIWLLELLSKTHKKGARELAEEILSAAKESGRGFDDMSVSVLRIGDAA